MSDLDEPARPSGAVATTIEEHQTKKMSWATARKLARDNISFLLVIASLVGIWTDPLFFYIPYMDDKHLCVETDHKIMIIVLIFRSLTDIAFVVDIIYHIRKAFRSTVVMGGSRKTIIAFAKNLSWWPVVVDILSILPMPQVLLFKVFYNPKKYGVPKNGLALNFFIFVQYVPRIYAAFLVSKEYRKIWPTGINATFYFFMYILTGYVFGGMWYFSAIQVQLTCMDIWGCQGLNECDSFFCGGSTKFTQMAAKAVAYCVDHEPGGWGSYDEIIESGYVGELNYRKKLLYFTWFGLKNLSNFGTSLDTSILLWENVFAILVCGMGMILFAYLIGHMQEFMRYASSEEKRTKKKMVNQREQKLQEWMRKYGLQITSEIKHQIRQDNVDDLGNTYCLPDPVHKSIFMKILRNVPELKATAGPSLLKMCGYLKPVIYEEKSFVFQTGEPLDSILFIAEGTVIIYSNADSSPTSRSVLKGGDVYGHKVLRWASTLPESRVSLMDLPISTENVRCYTKVEGFVLNAKDLKNVSGINPSGSII